MLHEHYVIQYDQREVCGFVGYVLLKYVNVGGRPTMRTFVIYFQYARYFSMQGRQQQGHANNLGPFLPAWHLQIACYIFRIVEIYEKSAF